MPCRAEPTTSKWLAEDMTESGPAICIVKNLVKPLAPKLVLLKLQGIQSYEFDVYFLSGAVQVAQSLPLAFIRIEETLEKHRLGSTMEALAQSIAVPPEDRLRLSEAIESAVWTLYQYVDLLKELVRDVHFRQDLISIIIGWARLFIGVPYCSCAIFWPSMTLLKNVLFVIFMLSIIDHWFGYLSNLEDVYYRNKRQANRTLDSIALSSEWLAYGWSLIADQLKKSPEIDKEVEMARIFLGEKQGRVALGDLGSQMMLDFLWRCAKAGKLADLPPGDGLGSDGEPFLLPPLVHRCFRPVGVDHDNFNHN
ncbi:hypothetical protein DFH06DRAFT_286814 [Mycena polygramma]|nr:hypothetical protein DFH06DRAFT_286814 [Mycena polygramma]